MSGTSAAGDESAGVTVPGARLPMHRAGADSLARRSAAAADAAHSTADAGAELVRDAGTALTHAGAGITGSFAAGGDRLRVSFHEIEALTDDIAAVSRDASELAASTARIAIDGGLLASFSVSPATGTAAEAAIGAAATGLARTALQASALAVSTGAVATSYAAADAWLTAAAGSLRTTAQAVSSLTRAGADFAGDLAGAAATSAQSAVGAEFGLAIATSDGVADLAAAAAAIPVLAAGGAAAVANGFGAETARALATAFADANRAFSGADDAVNPFVTADVIRYGSVLAAGFDRAFSFDDAVAGSTGGVQAILGATGPLYDDILAGLVTAGVAVGFFHDGEVTVRPAEDVDQTLLGDSAAVTWSALGCDGDTRFDTIEGRVLPTDWASMMAGLVQIDELGGEERAIIRVFTVHDSNGTPVSHRVQIPSTASWNPIANASGSPGDLTSDMHSMSYGADAALASSVFEAMRQAGIATGSEAPPVTLDGFSLGGITAAAIAADSRGFNVSEIHTAGAPIGRMNVDPAIGVFALEADQDLVAALDGRPNPARAGWLTVTGPGMPLAGEKATPQMLPGTVHSARRYAAMGAVSVDLQHVGALDVPSGGSVTVADFESRREPN